MPIQSIDQFLLKPHQFKQLEGLPRYALEFLYFGLKQARACLFAGLFLSAVFLLPRAGLLGIPKYDALLLIAIGIQIWMVATKLETKDELLVICLFHVIGFALEVFKTSQGIKSWAYPDFGYTKLFGVPLFSGFMYASVGSYMTQSWRLMDLRIRYHPPYWMATIIALLIYVNFFTHHFIGDFRWYIAACAVGLYARTMVIFTPLDRDRKMPLLLSFVLIGFFVWLAENISTLFHVWQYPNQVGAWATVSVGKWSSWSLLVVMTFTLVAHLKHIKKKIHIP